VSGLRGEDEAEGALPRAAVRKSAIKRKSLPVRDTVLDSNGPVRSDGPFYGLRSSSNGLILPRGPFDLPTYRSIRRKEPLSTRPSSPNP
jgi:hypothetical protein